MSDHIIRYVAALHIDQLLQFLDGLDDAESVEISRGNGRYELSLRVRRLGAEVETMATTSATTSATDAKLMRIHRKILEKASVEEPMTAKRLIALAGYKDNSYAWAAITFLARCRLLLRTPDGYLRCNSESSK